MVSLQLVHGDVLIDDVAGRRCEPAKPGMQLAEGGEYLIATAPNGRAEIMISGKSFSLGPSSLIHINGTRSWTGRHTLTWKKDYIRLAVGKIWALIDRDPRDDAAGNPVVGVRG